MEKIKIYAAVIEGQPGLWYWIDPFNVEPKLGEWAIVENKSGYSLAKIVGEVTCLGAFVPKFSNNFIDKMKRIIDTIDVEKLLCSHENHKPMEQEPLRYEDFMEEYCEIGKKLGIEVGKK